MVSRAQDLYNAYCESNSLNDEIEKCSQEILSLQNQLSSKLEERSYYDFKNKKVIEEDIKRYIDKEIAAEEERARQVAKYQISTFNEQENDLTMEYVRFKSWFFKKKSASSKVQNCNPIIYSSESDMKAKPHNFVLDASGKTKLILTIFSFFALGPAFLAYFVVEKILSIILDEGLISFLSGIIAGFVGFALWWSFIFTAVPILGVFMALRFRNGIEVLRLLKEVENVS